MQEHKLRHIQSTHLASQALPKEGPNRSNSSSLMRLYRQLDPESRLALNSSFLTNVKSGRNHQTFHQALKQHANNSRERAKAQKVIERIFPKDQFKVPDAVQKRLHDSYLKQTKASQMRKEQIYNER